MYILGMPINVGPIMIKHLICPTLIYLYMYMQSFCSLKNILNTINKYITHTSTTCIYTYSIKYTCIYPHTLHVYLYCTYPVLLCLVKTLLQASALIGELVKLIKFLCILLYLTH